MVSILAHDSRRTSKVEDTSASQQGAPQNPVYPTRKFNPKHTPCQKKQKQTTNPHCRHSKTLPPPFPPTFFPLFPPPSRALTGLPPPQTNATGHRPPCAQGAPSDDSPLASPPAPAVSGSPREAEPCTNRKHTSSDTVDGCEIHFAPPKKPGNDAIPLKMPTNNGVPRLQSGAGFCPSTVGPLKASRENTSLVEQMEEVSPVNSKSPFPSFGVRSFES